MSNLESAWKTLFAEWSPEIPRRGVIINSLNEQIPFNGFMTSEHFVLFSRSSPDAMGARMVLMPYDSLVTLKITDVVKSKTFQSAGFQGELGRQ
ncbi:MAG: hypothetical protein JW888_06230 [Pirellulales bacterium]|nr:hypothetical protein [Pirellulales bacterium]